MYNVKPVTVVSFQRKTRIRSHPSVAGPTVFVSKLNLNLASLILFFSFLKSGQPIQRGASAIGSLISFHRVSVLPV